MCQIIHCKPRTDTLISPFSSLPDLPTPARGWSGPERPVEIYTEIIGRINCTLNRNSKALAMGRGPRVIHF